MELNVGCCVGVHTSYICERVASVAHFHILLGCLPCDIQCHYHDAWKSKGWYLNFQYEHLDSFKELDNMQVIIQEEIVILFALLVKTECFTF